MSLALAAAPPWPALRIRPGAAPPRPHPFRHRLKCGCQFVFKIAKLVAQTAVADQQARQLGGSRRSGRRTRYYGDRNRRRSGKQEIGAKPRRV